MKFVIIGGNAAVMSAASRAKRRKPDIDAARDGTDAYHIVSGEKCWMSLALRANRAGWAVTGNIFGLETRLPGLG